MTTTTIRFCIKYDSKIYLQSKIDKNWKGSLNKNIKKILKWFT